VVGVLGNFSDEPRDFAELGRVGGDGDGGGAWGFVGERVEGGNGGGAGVGFARGDEDFGTAGLEETGSLCVSILEVRPETNCVPGCSV
jgi:hypothetical protein